MEEKQGWSWKQQIYNIARNVAARWHLICLAAVAAAVMGDLILTLTYVPQYRTEASFVIRMPAYGTEGTEEAEIAEALQYILTSNVFLNRIREELELDEISGTYTVKETDGTNIVEIAAEADSPRTSYLMMYAMMDKYKEVTDLVIGDMQIDILEKMSVPMQPDNPVRHRWNLLFFAAAGGCALVFILGGTSYTRDTVKDRSMIKNRLQIRLLGTVPSETKLVMRRTGLHIKKALLVTQITTSLAFVETFRRIGDRFEAAARKHKYKVITINSTIENEGKTSLAVNLAIVLAQKGKKVLVIDGDMGKPAVGKIMDMVSDKGMEEVLKGKAELGQALCTHERTGVDFLLTRRPVPCSSELLEQESLAALLRECRASYDYVFIDTPPAGIMGDALIIAGYSDAVLLVVRQDYTPLPLISRTIDRYLAQDTPVLGCVLNRTMPVFRKRNRMLPGEGEQYGK